jgi:AcrR family transcriptional regulator
VNSPSPDAVVLDARDHRVFDAVRDLLATQGMQLSMESVAQQAGCSKQTLYSRYGSKQELLRRVMQRHLCRATAGLRALDGEDLRGSLLEFASDYVDHFNEPNVAQACRLIAADSSRFPDEARSLYRDGAGALALHLAEWLHLRIKRGLLRHDDPHFMAELLLSMIAGLDFEKQRFHTPHRADASQRRRWAEFSVDSFLRAFAAPEALPILHSNQHRSFS